MKIIDRYILKRFLGSFIFVVFILVLVISVIDLTEKMDKYVTAALTPLEIMGYYKNFIPFVANLITPITTFIATVFVSAKMAGHTEIIAILSSGVSFRRMLVPYFIGASLIAIASFFLTGWIIPNSNKERLAFEIEYLERKYYYDKTNIHMQIAPSIYLYMRNYNNTSNTGYRFTLERLQGTEIAEKLSADRIEWNDELGKWKLKNWNCRKFVENAEVITEGREMDTTLAIHPQEFENQHRNFEGMTINELDDHIAKLRLRGATNVEIFEVEKYVRFTSPFAVLILTFMGTIVASRKRRGGAGFQIALGFLLSFIFILFFMMTKTVAEAGSMDPAFSVWIPNVIFGIISLIMYKFVPR